MSEKAVIVCVEHKKKKDFSSLEDNLAELQELCEAAGLEIVGSHAFNQGEPNSSIFIGRGKAEAVAHSAKISQAQTVVFDCDLSPSQQRNLEDLVLVKTLDRTQVILDIFAARAKSTEGKLQVELAQLKYLLPRLGGQGIYLSRLGGGVGTRGPGEQKLEMDKRKIRERITRLEKDLEDMQRRREDAIQKKKEKNIPLVCLVGYTNAGKSSLFNLLSRQNVLVKNQLFSTLDTKTAAIETAHGQKYLLADTVGFVRRLPHHLVESFKATLEEASFADLLLHVIDASRSDLDEIRKSVELVLESLGAGNKKTRIVLNKADLLSDDKKQTLISQYRGLGVDFVILSTRSGEGVIELHEVVQTFVSQNLNPREYFVSNQNSGLRARVYEYSHVLSVRDDEQGCYLRVMISEVNENMLKKSFDLKGVGY